MLLVDFIRYQQHLMGTKIGCNEGDCGACTVLVGELVNNELQYRSFTSCLTPLGNVNNKHVVSIEGINGDGMNPIQQAMCDESATQCGFCTPGFVMSLAGFCLSKKEPTLKKAIAAMDGNICRCTGYKSIERAAAKVATFMQENNEGSQTHLIKHQILPIWFAEIKERLKTLLLQSNGQFQSKNLYAHLVGGGTDLYVQKHDELKYANNHFLFDHAALKGITKDGNRCVIGPSATVTDLSDSQVMREYFPKLDHYINLVSSTPIRNMATVGGNFINASPIGDLTIFFLALNATLVLSDGRTSREMPLKKLYKDYKVLDKKPEEHIEKIFFELPAKNSLFNFEKVSKRVNLDIASVNSAIHIVMDGEVIKEAFISAGGVAPVPKLLEKTSAFLKVKTIDEGLIAKAINIMQTEITPISDTRGSAEYKRLLLGQLIKAHFIVLFPGLTCKR